MSDQVIAAVVTVLTALIGVALIATLVSKNANTAGVLGAGGSSFATALGAATGPVSGGFGFGGLSGLSFTGGGGL